MEKATHIDLAEIYARKWGYADDERVEAVFLVGSSASGKEDIYSDIDMLVAVNEVIPDSERLEKLRSIGCHNIMLSIAGVENPALPVKSQVIDKFVFHETWFDVSYHLPHQLEFCFDYVTLVDKDDLTSHLCREGEDSTEAELKERVQADLRLLRARIHRYEKYVRRKEWVGLDLSAIKNLLVDLVMVLNDRPNYNRHSSRISRLLIDLSVKPEHFDRDLLDILHLDNREAWPQKIDMLNRIETELISLCEERWGQIAMFDDQELNE